jgi:hypothetical protein
MFFLWLGKFLRPPVSEQAQRLLRVGEFLIMVGLPLGGTYVVALAMEKLGEQLFPRLDVSFAAQTFYNIGAFVVLKLTIERVVRYKIAPLFNARLAFSQEEVSGEFVTVVRGTPVVELLMGEFYDYARYWPLRLTPRELTLILYRETFNGLLTLIEKMKSGWPLIPETAVMMIYTPLLKDEYARRLQAVISPRMLKQDDLKKKRLVHYRLKIMLALGVNPFSRNLILPKFYRRGYFLAKSLLQEDLERDLRREVARLSSLVAEVLAHKRWGWAYARLRRGAAVGALRQEGT